MIDLLSKYSAGEIITFIVILFLAIKGVINSWDWAREKVLKIFKKESRKEQEKRELDGKLLSYDEKIEQVIKAQEELNDYISNMMRKINILIDSDKDDIKSFITKEHHFYCYEKHWIDDYSLDCIERRYKHYQEENGNSFVADLMKEIRQLPKQEPIEN